MNDNATFSFSGLRDSDYQSIEMFVKTHFSIEIKVYFFSFLFFFFYFFSFLFSFVVVVCMNVCTLIF